jgi:hypothetical protein
MALFRRLSVLLTTLLLATTSGLAADQPLSLEAVIAKARAAAAVDPAALTKLRTLRLEFTSLDEKGKSEGRMTLTLAAPGYRHQLSVSEEPVTTTAVCAGRLEGWTTRQRGPLTGGPRRSARSPMRNSGNCRTWPAMTSLSSPRPPKAKAPRNTRA